ncbi:hypothetical protein ACFV23_46470, partial [Streptomyces sp. NPDC059627]
PGAATTGVFTAGGSPGPPAPGASANGGATGGSGSGAAGGSSAQPSVDPDTGQTISPGGATGSASGGTGTGADGTVALAQPVAVATAHGWTGTQTLMLLAAVLVFGLLLLPSLVSRLVGSRAEGNGNSGGNSRTDDGSSR